MKGMCSYPLKMVDMLKGLDGGHADEVLGVAPNVLDSDMVIGVRIEDASFPCPLPDAVICCPMEEYVAEVGNLFALEYGCRSMVLVNGNGGANAGFGGGFGGGFGCGVEEELQLSLPPH